MYALIEAGGKQLKVTTGDQVSVEKIKGELNSEIVFNKVLMISKDGKTLFGEPFIEGASVKAEIIKEGKAPKVMVLGPAPKKACRRLKGHRQPYKVVRIKEIIGG
ncbi:MAG: 50S ribosomal protein L21 [Thermodesulfovibrionales bacterium]|nr:50S ribosomal protein L21 [Thermodesulfovibrionales bacterium]